MAANTLFSDPFLYVVNSAGCPLVGAKATFFIAGSSTPTDVFTDSDCQIAWSQPVETNAAGQSDGPIYILPTPALKIVIVDADDVPVDGFPLDNFSPSAVAS